MDCEPLNVLFSKLTEYPDIRYVLRIVTLPDTKTPSETFECQHHFRFVLEHVVCPLVLVLFPIPPSTVCENVLE